MVMAEEKISYLEPIEDVSDKGKESGEGHSLEKEATLDQAILPKSEAHQEKEQIYQDILATQTQAQTDIDAQSVSDDAQKLSLQTDADSKVTQLIELANTKGVVYAVKVARHLEDFYVLDQMHDDLADKFYTSLKERGLIE
jgi:hypothetical protein